MRSIALVALASGMLGCLHADVNRCGNGAICRSAEACTDQPVCSESDTSCVQHPLCGVPELVQECHPAEGPDKRQFYPCAYSAADRGTCHFSICDHCEPFLAGCDATWDPIESNTGEDLIGIWVYSEDDAIAVGATSVLRYDGFAWTHDTQSEVAIANLLGMNKIRGIVGFRNSPELFVLGNTNQVLRYANGSWTETAVASVRPPNAIWGSSPDNVVTVGPFGEICRFDGSAWSIMVAGSATMAPNLVYAAVGGTGPSDIYAVGQNGASLNNPLKPDGTVHHFDGTSWSELRALPDQELRSIWASSMDHVFTAGPPASLLPISQYDGTMWTDYPVAGADGSAIWGTSPSDVLVAGSAGIYRLEGTAMPPTWALEASVEVAAIAGSSVMNADASSSTTVFAVGAAGRIWRYSRNRAN